jgi:hypothetical protein
MVPPTCLLFTGDELDLLFPAMQSCGSKMLLASDSLAYPCPYALLSSPTTVVVHNFIAQKVN